MARAGAAGRRGPGRRRGEVVIDAWRPDAPAEDRRSAPVAGSLDVESYVAASLGPPRWLERLQDIEAEEYRVAGALRRAWLDLAEHAAGGGEPFAAAWQRRAAAFDLSALNLLIDQHNEYFPIERRLPFDHRTGDYRAPWGIAWRRARRDARWVLERFPADLGVARAELRLG